MCVCVIRALLGELSKWVPVSVARFSNLAFDADVTSVRVAGAHAEPVTVSFFDVSTASKVDVTCTLPASGVITVLVPSAVCVL